MRPGAVVVTGGGGALGTAVVAALLDAGARVAVPVRDPAGVEALRRDHGDDVLAIEADLTRDEDADRLAAVTAARLGPVVGLACLAGGYAEGRVEALTADAWRALFDRNVVTAATATRALLPELRRTAGSIVYVGSRIAYRPFPGAAHSIVAKAGLHALVGVVAQEERGHGVRANAVVPGTIDTPANRAAMPGGDPDAWTAPERVAAAVLWLLDDASSAVTGALVPVDRAG